MNILLTNDDGVASEGIIRLEAALKRAGHTTFVVAPDRDRSGYSNAVSFRKSFSLTRKAENVWACGGTPADCVITVAAGALSFRPDLVLSGINAGENMGTDLVYSATAGGARQAVLCGWKAAALSLYDGNGPYLWDEAASWAASHTADFAAWWKPDTFVNINFPNAGLAGAKVERGVPALRVYTDRARLEGHEEGEMVCVLDLGSVQTVAGPGTDVAIVRAGNIALSNILTQPLAG